MISFKSIVSLGASLAGVSIALVGCSAAPGQELTGATSEDIGICPDSASLIVCRPGEHFEGSPACRCVPNAPSCTLDAGSCAAGQVLNVALCACVPLPPICPLPHPICLGGASLSTVTCQCGPICVERHVCPLGADPALECCLPVISPPGPLPPGH